jgi:hypothetical protein
MSSPSPRTILAAAAATLLSGCILGVATAPPEHDAAAKQFRRPPPGMAALYVYRNEIWQSAARLHLLLNGQPLGTTTGQRYVVAWVGPGKHQLVSKGGNESALEIDAKPGGTYFVWQEAKAGLLGTNTALHLVDEATGQAGVSQCTLVASGGP